MIDTKSLFSAFTYEQVTLYVNDIETLILLSMKRGGMEIHIIYGKVINIMFIKIAR